MTEIRYQLDWTPELEKRLDDWSCEHGVRGWFAHCADCERDGKVEYFRKEETCH